MEKQICLHCLKKVTATCTVDDKSERMGMLEFVHVLVLRNMNGEIFFIDTSVEMAEFIAQFKNTGRKTESPENKAIFEVKCK